MKTLVSRLYYDTRMDTLDNACRAAFAIVERIRLRVFSPQWKLRIAPTNHPQPALEIAILLRTLNHFRVHAGSC